MLGDFWKWGRRVGEVLGTTILLTCSPERVSWLPFPTSPEVALSLRPIPHWSITGSPLLSHHFTLRGLQAPHLPSVTSAADAPLDPGEGSPRIRL